MINVNMSICIRSQLRLKSKEQPISGVCRLIADEYELLLKGIAPPVPEVWPSLSNLSTYRVET